MLHRRATTLAVSLAAVLLLLPVGQAAAGQTSRIQLDPSSGPPGTLIRVTPDLERPGGPSGCAVELDDQPAGSFPCGREPDSGELGWTTLTAPAAPGWHIIKVCVGSCEDVDSPWSASATFTVLAVVPDLGSRSLTDARQQLELAGLALGSVQGPSDDPDARVNGQDPPPGAEVEAGSAVNVTVAVPGPRLITVPDLVGRTREEAAALVTSRRLRLRVASGTGRVQAQDPPPGSQVAPGSVVTVTLQAPPGQVLVAVPDVRGRTASDAQAAVAAAGLVLRATGPPTGTVQTQSPSPRTRVLPGSEVTVNLLVPSSTSTTTPPPPPGEDDAGLLIGLALLVLAVLLIALAVRMLRSASRRRSSRWVREHVRVTAGAKPSQPGDTQIGEAGPGPTRAVGLEPHPDRGSQILEEAQR